METKPCQCLEIQENLSAYVDGEVTKSERAMVETHLSECGACREKLSETMRVIAAVAALPRVEAGPAYCARLKERLEQPDSLLERLSRLMDDRMAISGVSFAMGAAACFLVFSLARPPAAPVQESSVEVAVAPRKVAPEVQVARAPAAPVSHEAAKAPVALAAAPSAAPVQPAGAPVLPARPPEPMVVASVPKAKAPLIVPPGPMAAPGVSEVELANMKLEVGTEPAPPAAFAGAPSEGQVAAKFARVSPGVPVSAARPELSRPLGLSRKLTADEEEIHAAVATAPEPVVTQRELAAAVPAGARLIEGDEAERSATGAGASAQVMVSAAPAFLTEVAGIVAKVRGVRLTRVLVLSAPALEIELELAGTAVERADAARQVNTQLAHATTVKAVAGAAVPADATKLTFHVPLAQPVAR